MCFHFVSQLVLCAHVLLICDDPSRYVYMRFPSSIVLAISMPKIIKFGADLTKF